MDGSTNDGDLNWFEGGRMMKEFETEVNKHKRNEVFEVNVSEKNWYYVVLKTFDDKKRITATVLKVKSGL